MNKRSISFLLVLLLTLTLTVPARGAEKEDYIFRLRPEATLPAEADVRPVFEPEGVYCTGDPALLRELEAAGALEYAEENETVTLFDYDEDLAALESEPWARAMLGTGYARRAGITGGYEEPLPVETEKTEEGPETKRGVRVGLIDSGLWPGFDDCTEAAVLPGTNYTVTEDDPARSNTEDTAGHGTFVASVLASREVGLAPNVEIVPLKCFTGKAFVTVIGIIL